MVNVKVSDKFHTCPRCASFSLSPESLDHGIEAIRNWENKASSWSVVLGREYWHGRLMYVLGLSQMSDSEHGQEG